MWVQLCWHKQILFWLDKLFEECAKSGFEDEILYYYDVKKPKIITVLHSGNKNV